MIGTVVHIGAGEHTNRQFAFLYCEELRRRVFFHFRHFRGGLKPEINQIVEFDLAPAGLPGHPDRATNVRPVSNDAGATALTSKVGV